MKRLERELGLSVDMLANEIEACPDSLWGERAGGFRFFQQILHALCGLEFWTRTAPAEFKEPFSDRALYPELDGEPEGSATKAELRDYAARVRAQALALVRGQDDAWLASPSALHGGVSNLDIIVGQIRHLMYHAGHCDAALRERGIRPPEWLEYRGE